MSKGVIAAAAAAAVGVAVAIGIAVVLTGGDGDGGAASLVGPTWQWEETDESDDSVTTPDDPSAYTVTLQPDGNVSIKADCNSAFGTYTLDGSSLQIEIGGSTRAQCAEGSLSDQYLQQLGSVASYVLEDGTLFLSLVADGGLMRHETG